MSGLLHHWPGAFLLTIIVELPILWLLFRRQVASPRILGAGLVVNAITHPVVWFLLPRLLPSNTAYLVVSEAFAMVVEALLLRALLTSCALSRALLASATANCVSYVVGLGLFVATVGRLP